jgi:ubiquinone/menaquinone biosynthesis C-methylase UbiE
MDGKLQRRVQRYGWDAAAPVYDSSWGERLKPAQDTLLEMAAPKPGMRVLEVACGTGLVTLRIAESVMPGGSVFATDIADEMVTETTAQAASNGLHNVEASRMGAEDLAVEDGSFDAALCALGLMYVPDPDKAISEMCRAVRQGGRVAVTVWGERRNCGWAGIFPIVDAHVQSEVCPLFFSLGAPGALVSALTSVGLTQVEESRLAVNLAWPDERSLLSAQIDGGAVALAAKRFSPEARREVETAFLDSVSELNIEETMVATPSPASS